MATIHPIETIISDPAIRSGQPMIAGTGLRVIDVVASYLYRGHGPEELATHFALDLGQVHAALAYYYQHKATVDQLIRSEAEKAETLLAQIEAQGRLIRLD